MRDYIFVNKLLKSKVAVSLPRDSTLAPPAHLHVGVMGDNFSLADTLRASISCCYSPRSTSPSLTESAPWYTQSAPHNPLVGSSRSPNEFEYDYAPNSREGRPADLFSLHSTRAEDWEGGGGRRGRRGGDISGGGAEEGSGLSRWKLLVSWFSGRRGAIRLEDATDGLVGREEDDEEVEGDRTVDSVQTNVLGLNKMRFGEADARELDDIIDLPVSTGGSRIGGSAASSSSASKSGRRNITLDDEENLDEEEAEERRLDERRVRKERRAMKRRAKELGLTLDEFHAGLESKLVDHPSSSLSTAYQSTYIEDSTTAYPAQHLSLPARPKRQTSASSTTSSADTDPFVHISKSTTSDQESTTNGSHGFAFEPTPAERIVNRFALGEVDDGAEEDELFGRENAVSSSGRRREGGSSSKGRSSKSGSSQLQRKALSNTSSSRSQSALPPNQDPRQSKTDKSDSTNGSSNYSQKLTSTDYQNQSAHPHYSNLLPDISDDPEYPLRPTGMTRVESSRSHKSQSSISTTVSGNSSSGTGSRYHNQRRKEAAAAVAASTVVEEEVVDNYSHIGQL